MSYKHTSSHVEYVGRKVSNETYNMVDEQIDRQLIDKRANKHNAGAAARRSRHTRYEVIQY